MDRVNRSSLMGATLIAIPVALLMVSFSEGTSPQVQQAGGTVKKGADEIQQVVGKQIERPRTRPGLLQVMTGNQPAGSHDHGHANMRQSESKGLLDALFNRGNDTRDTTHSQHHHHNHHATHASRTHSASPQPTGSTSQNGGEVSWDGIPYHQVGKQRTTGPNVPVVDPNDAIGSGKTRIIRGGATHSAPARTASARRSPTPSLAPTPAPPLAVPAPPAEVGKSRSSNDSTSETLSRRSSSRRSGRRKVEALDAETLLEESASAALAAAPSSTSSSASGTASSAPRASSDKQTSLEQELVPRVARKPIKKKTTSAQPAANNTNVAATETAEATSPAKNAAPTTTAPKVASSGGPSATLLHAAQPTVEPSSQPTSAAPAPASMGTPKPTPAGNRAPQVVSNQPVLRPQVGPTPSAAIPSAPASHRSGPPQSAFAPLPNTETPFSAASAPVGSGVVPHGEIASYRGNSQTTLNDPYAPAAQQPYTTPEASATQPRSAQSQAGETKATNTQSTTGGATLQSIPQVPDQFASTDAQARAQTRDRTSEGPLSASASSEVPGIRVVTQGPSSVMLRQTAQYEIRVENRGAIDASGVVVRTLVPQWAEIRSRNTSRGQVQNRKEENTERLVWTIDQLPAGTSERLFVRLTAAQSGTFELDVDWTLLPQRSLAQVQVHEPRLDLTIEGPEEVIYGESATYKVRVLNPGDGTAPNVVFTLSPNSATPQTQRIGDIPPGKEAQFDVELTAQDLGDLKIHGLASGDLELRSEAAKTIRVASAKLEAILSGPELKYQNSEAMYGLQVQNTGTAVSKKIRAALRLPVGVRYVGGLDEASVQDNNLSWEIPALAPGATREYQFRCDMQTTGEHLFAFDCNGSAAGNASVSISTRVESIADLVLTVSDPPAPAPIGRDVTYEIVIRNRGSKEATDVRAVAQFSHGIEPQRTKGQQGEVLTGQVVFEPIDRIAAGQEVRLQVIAKADTAGHHRFRTEIRSGDTLLVAEEATHYLSAQSDRVSRRSSDASNR